MWPWIKDSMHTYLLDKDRKISTWGCLGQVCILDRSPGLFQDTPSVLQVRQVAGAEAGGSSINNPFQRQQLRR